MRSPTDISGKSRRTFDEIVRRHERGVGGIRTAFALTERLDTLVGGIFGTLQSENAAYLTVVALGGYGRR